LPEKLLGIGYYTGSLYFNPMVGPYSGFNRGYKEYVLGVDKTNSFVDEAPKFLSHAGDQPFFLSLHTMETHDPYWTPYPVIQTFGHISADTKSIMGSTMRDFNSASLRDFLAQQSPGTTDSTDFQTKAMATLDELKDEFNLLYDASVLWADQNASDIIEMLKQQGIWDKSIFIFLSDHGEEIGERGGWFHGQSVYEELLRVPLLIHFPGDEYAGLRVPTAVSLVDLMPTIFDYLNRPELCEECRGKSLLSILGDPGNSDSHPLVIPSLRLNEPFYYRPWLESRGNVNVVVLEGAWKGIWNDDLQTLELYDLRSDPDERLDRSKENADLTGQMIETARQWLENCERLEQQPEVTPELDEETKRQLRAVGYFD